MELKPGTQRWRRILFTRSRRVGISRLVWPLGIVAGASLGIGGYTFSYAKGLSYLSTNPNACANCHIMGRQLDSYRASSHHDRALCVDCHLPDDFAAKYYAKAENGWRHSKEFTTQMFPEPIALKPESHAILQANCVRCHEPLVDSMGAARSPSHDGRLDCVHCHAAAGHGERAALGGPRDFDLASAAGVE